MAGPSWMSKNRPAERGRRNSLKSAPNHSPSAGHSSLLSMPATLMSQHGRLQARHSVIVHGAAGAVGSMATQLAREAGDYVIGAGRAADRQTALDFGANEFVDLENAVLEDVGRVDLVFDVIGGDIGKRSAGLIRAGGTPLVRSFSMKPCGPTGHALKNSGSRSPHSSPTEPSHCGRSAI
jgi:D-arabinose 1-dehydrogenase-like Zn-dependent alcohol dehydrogenase